MLHSVMLTEEGIRPCQTAQLHVGAEEEGEGVNDYDRTDTFLADDEEEGGEGEDEDDAGAVKHRKCAAGLCMNIADICC